MWTAPVKYSYRGSQSFGIGHERGTDEIDDFGGIWFAKTQDKHWRIELVRPPGARGHSFIRPKRNRMWFSWGGGINEILVQVRARAFTLQGQVCLLQVKGGLNIYFLSTFPLQFKTTSEYSSLELNCRSQSFRSLLINFILINLVCLNMF